MQLEAMMYGFAAPGDNARGRARDWSLADIEAIGNEIWPDALPEPLDEYSYTMYSELPQCLRVTPEKIPQCARDLVRLKGKNLYLTKQVCTFGPEEMHDLEFKPAIPLLAAALSDPVGDAAAAVLRLCGTNAIPALLAACQDQLLATNQCLVGPPGATGHLLGRTVAHPPQRRCAKSQIQRRHG